ncbi:MAG: hypothetical protein GX230_09765 [Lentisphaerae bacterium]|nr:hypothetical protein [Lentisphaerota bacterium]
MNLKKETRVGILPLYLKLYDDLDGGRRSGFDGFIDRVAAGLKTHGISVTAAPVCRIAPEFNAAIAAMEGKVDVIITIHLAYSPSLEVIDALCKTTLPIIILDTTMEADFGLSVRAKHIMTNHGVHGVMDLACMLRRRGRHFEIVAGHDSDPRLYERAAALARAAFAVGQFRNSKALRVGPAFDGMGDFCVSENLLAERFGITVQELSIDALDAAVTKVREDLINAELAADNALFTCDISEEDHLRSIRVGLGLRRLVADGGFGALSVNFQAFDGTDRPAATMPFMELSKGMARGVGYGGEGDILTAALVGALARSFERVTFTEIFCADWAGDSLFLSHMGEISPSVLKDKPRLFAKPFFVPGVPPPAVITGAARPGPAAFVNLAPGPDNSFTLIVAPVEVLPESDSIDPAMFNTVRIWIKPRLPVAPFLEEYSRNGGTHHSALVLGDVAEAIAAFGRQTGLDVVTIG